MLIVTDGNENLRAADWVDCETRMYRLLKIHYRGNPFKIEAVDSKSRPILAIGRYFRGDLTAIDTLRVKTAGTPFQEEVWRALRNIPRGATISYAELARRVGRPAAIRAVGAANGSNPVGVVIPCHRVIGSDGSLSGYAGGIERKAWLLRHEAQGSTQ